MGLVKTREKGAPSHCLRLMSLGQSETLEQTTCLVWMKSLVTEVMEIVTTMRFETCNRDVDVETIAQKSRTQSCNENMKMLVAMRTMQLLGRQRCWVGSCCLAFGFDCY